MQNIYLSPHFDDAALSCGGAIARHSRVGDAAVVVTIFGGKPDYAQLSPFARSIYARPNAGTDPIGARLAEEHDALAILGAQSRTYPYLDCIYRQDALGKRWLYDSEEAIFGSVDTADDGLVDKLERDLMALAATPETCRIYAPLAIGNHVDHQVAHLSARRLHDAGYTAYFYEDYPYVVRDPADLEKTLTRWGERSQWHSEIIALRRNRPAAKDCCRMRVPQPAWRAVQHRRARRIDRRRGGPARLRRKGGPSAEPWTLRRTIVAPGA